MTSLSNIRFPFYICTVSCFIELITSSLTMVWLSPLTEWLSSSKSEIPMTEDEVSWLVSVGPIGCVVGAIPFSLISDRFGRKKTQIGMGVLLALCWAVIVVTRHKWALFSSQVVAGIVAGGLFTVGPIYLSEISPPEQRGAITGQLNTMFFVGQVVSYAAGPVLTYTQFVWLCAALPILFLITFISAPESPYYLLSKGKQQEAMNIMTKLRGIEAALELDTTPDTNEVDDTTLWEVFKQNGHIKNLICLMIISGVSQNNGNAQLGIYGEQFVGGQWVTLYMGIIYTVVASLASFLPDKFGRKPLLIGSMAGSAVFTLILVAYFNYSYIHMLLYIGVFGFCIVSTMGLNVLVLTLPSELFPTRLRALAAGIGNVTAGVMASVAIKIFVPVNRVWGVQGNFIIASVASLIGAAAAIFLPETAKTTIASA